MIETILVGILVYYFGYYVGKARGEKAALTLHKIMDIAINGKKLP